ncbi:MAG: tetratricopeptide repeat protein [Candidatus Solibacter usitatus]|nr:tetratricopeptide repeat protein [Candidatus Solibacter usitatus]
MTEKGQAEAAIAGWKKALELNPGDAKAHNNLGGAPLKQGKLDEAAAHFRRALESEPELFNARDNPGRVLLQGGKGDEAVRQWRRALETNASPAEARVNLGGALMMQGKHAEALAQLREALRLEPDRTAIMGNMAWLLAASPDAKVRNGAEAVALGERAAALTGRKDAVILDTLGAAYAEAGRFAEAARSAREALSLAEQRKDAEMTPAVRARIALFELGRPYREPR